MTIFSKIINGDIPCFRLAENDQFLSFLDINPLKHGHALVVPKVEVDYIFDLEDTTLSEMMLFSKKVAKAIERVVPCERIGVAVLGLEVPHAHIHLVPINGIADIDFSQQRVAWTEEEFTALAERIRGMIEDESAK